MKRISNNISLFKFKINRILEQVLNHYKNRTKGTMNFLKLSAILNQDVNGIGQSIVTENKTFQGYILSLFNEKTQTYDIDYVLKNLKGDSIDIDQLTKRYREFQNIYDDLIKNYLKINIELDILIVNTKSIARNIKQTSNIIKWDSNVRDRIPKLLAFIFALWTLQNANYYFQAGDVTNKNNYLLKPHAAQIVSILRMLGIGDNKEELKNNLVQIGTGEGKSIILGAIATIFALLGFDVSCVCYSEYLSEKDYIKFLPIFDSLGLLQYIHYGTFNKLYEDINGNIRQIVEQFISIGSNNTIRNNQHDERTKILLIDEVDIFFSRDFFGNVYIPSVSLRDPTITSLINFIWSQRKSNLKLNQVETTVEYKACCNRFPIWEKLIREAVKDIIYDMYNFESHNYIVKEDKIGYIEQDNIVYNVVYSYKTLFAYYYEHEKGKITSKSLEEKISLRIKCGNFLYAKIPLQFTYIMGVTGTLKTLSDSEKQIIQDAYYIKKNTYIPSMFGRKNLMFRVKDDIIIENSIDYFNAIRKEIDDRLIEKSSEKRAVLVFFESKQRLKEFYESKALETIKQSVAYLTEESSSEEKEIIIKRATSSGQITLFTRIFGRGTDFICYDPNATANGGTHVIQTFLSEEWSEEQQIKNRTARQGDAGSYSMVLLDCDLEKFLIQKEDIENVKKGRQIQVCFSETSTSTKSYDTVYDLLHDKRTALFKTQYKAHTIFIRQMEERCVATKKFLSSLNSGDVDSVRTFLEKENKGTNTISHQSRIVCLIDATDSMSHFLHNCKNTLETMFERTTAILSANNISRNSFQIQFVAYRNYNSTEDKILQSSRWESKGANLCAFMNTINSEGDWGNEAIEIGLWHINRENEREDITQVILIGDAPPNTKSEVKQKRNRRGEAYWKQTKFAQATYYEDELAKLISKSIPVHTFFVDNRAEVIFKEIAQRTGGKCERLDINSPLGAEMLTKLVTEPILNVCRNKKGNSLIETYQYKFEKSYA
ncbi:unnamed protein product [Rotaria sordida]|uniref:SecA family profile domain-containing protein n=1 Tax=Rotaria sordida TaxID=392033 RepID=A0A819KXD2_9BILA|nr:unnamed protein product [Rotaria sordida]